MSVKNNGTSQQSTTEMSLTQNKLRRLFTPRETDSDRFHAQQLYAALRLAPFTESTLTVVAIVICALFWDRVSHSILLVWASAVVLTNISWYGFWISRERSGAWDVATRGDIRVAVWHAGIRATL